MVKPEKFGYLNLVYHFTVKLTISCVNFPVKVTCELFLKGFFFIFEKKCQSTTFRWLILFIAFTQVVFPEKVCFIETTSFNYPFTETCHFLVVTHY